MATHLFANAGEGASKHRLCDARTHHDAVIPAMAYGMACSLISDSKRSQRNSSRCCHSCAGQTTRIEYSIEASASPAFIEMVVHHLSFLVLLPLDKERMSPCKVRPGC